MKTYVPVGNVERETSHCPMYLAWIVLDEVRDYLRVPIPESYADHLARRAEIVFKDRPDWARAANRTSGREFLLGFIRHWLAGILAKERPALFRELPDEFKIGGALPPHTPAPAKRRCRSGRGFRPSGRLALGCEVPAV